MSVPIKIAPFLLSLSLLFLFFSSYETFSISDSADMLNVGISIYELHDTSHALMENIDTGEKKFVYSKYGLGLPLMLEPLLFANDLLHKVSDNINSNIILSITNMVILAATAQVLFLIFISMGYGSLTGFALSFGAIFGTFALPYVNFFFSEPLQGLMLTASFYFILRSKSAKSLLCVNLLFALAGLTLGYAVFTKAATLILLPVLSAYAIATTSRYGRRGFATPLLCFFIPILLFGALIAFFNYSHNGSIFEFGYGSETTMFTTPLFTGLKNLLINPSKSIFIFAPLASLFPYAVFVFYRRFKAEASVVVALFLINIIFYSKWWAWEGGDSWGPRFLLPIVPLMVVPLAELFRLRPWRILICVLFVVGFLVNLLPILQDSSAFNYMVLKSTPAMELANARGRTDYEQTGSYRQIPPYVVTSSLSDFNVIEGHLWLLRARLSKTDSDENNRILQAPPWIESYPSNRPPAITTLPREIRIRLACPTPILLSRLLCPGRIASAPIYYDALVNQSLKARHLGREEDARRLTKKAEGEKYEKIHRIKQMRVL